MATEAAWLECKEFTGRKEKTERAKRKRKTHLTHTGLLMEGLDWSPTFAEAYGEVFTSVQTLAFAAFSMLKLGRGRASAWRTFLPASFESSPLQISTEDGEHQIPPLLRIGRVARCFC